MGLAACDTGRLQSPTTEHAAVSHTTGRANLPSDHHVNCRYMQYPHCNALLLSGTHTWYGISLIKRHTSKLVTLSTKANHFPLNGDPIKRVHRLDPICEALIEADHFPLIGVSIEGT